MKRIFIFTLLFTLFSIAFSQKKYTISGYVKEAKSGESLVGATILLKNTELGAYSNEYGFYSITVPQAEYVVIVDFLGYKRKEVPVSLTENVSLNFNMETEDVRGDEVMITDERGDKNVKSTEMGTVEMPIENIRKLPVLLGEVDIMKTIQLLPGVQAAEGTSGLYIRGGGPDQNLVLLDEAPVYNTGHLFGFFSVFNGDAVRDFKLYKGSMPAQYGGRLASVIDVSMKEGNNQTFHGKGGVGLISSRLTLEGPIIKNKASFMVSARRTYVDVLAQPFVKKTSQFKGTGYYFYDANIKLNYTINDKNRIFVSGYFGRDVFTFKSKFSDFKFTIPWGNSTATVRWNHLFSPKLFLNATAIYNDYNFNFTTEFNRFSFGLSSRIKDVNGKVDFDYFPSVRHKIKFGANYIFHTFSPNGLRLQIDTLKIDRSDVFKRYGAESSVYAQDDWEVTDKLQISGGVRFSGFQQLGAYTHVNYDGNNTPIDSIKYGKGKTVKKYGAIEPRISARYSLGYNTSLKASFNHNAQYLHMVSISGTFPSDIWVPSSLRVKPQKAEQYSLGIFKNWKQNTFEVSVEGFYRSMRNLVEYSQYYSFDVRNDYELQYVVGKGRAYGVEFFLQKTRGKLTGWLGYTLARSQRKFDNPDPAKQLNDGKWFAYTYDRRHNVSFVITYEMNELRFGSFTLYKRPVTLSGVFVYGTGNAITPILRRYFIDNKVVNLYGPRNSLRMPDYHRSDISMTLHGKPNRKFQSDWVISVYNVYSRQNPYFVYFDSKGDQLSQEFETKAYQVSVFPIIPSVTWDFKF